MRRCIILNAFCLVAFLSVASFAAEELDAVSFLERFDRENDPILAKYSRCVATADIQRRRGTQTAIAAQPWLMSAARFWSTDGSMRLDLIDRFGDQEVVTARVSHANGSSFLMYKSESSSKYTVREWSSESHRQKFIGEEIRDEGWPFWAHSYFLGVELAKDLREGGVEITGFEVREPSNNSPRSVYVAFLGPTQKGSSLQTKGELVVLPDSSFAIKSIELKAFDRSGAGSEEENWKWTNKMDVEYVDSHVRLPKIQSVSMVSEDSSGVTNLSEAVVTHMDFEANISHDRFGLKEFDIEVIPRPESKVWILFVSLLLIVAVLVLNTCLRARRQKRAGGVLE